MKNADHISSLHSLVIRCSTGFIATPLGGGPDDQFSFNMETGHCVNLKGIEPPPGPIGHIQPIPQNFERGDDSTNYCEGYEHYVPSPDGRGSGTCRGPPLFRTTGAEKDLEAKYPGVNEKLNAILCY